MPTVLQCCLAILAAPFEPCVFTPPFLQPRVTQSRNVGGMYGSSFKYRDIPTYFLTGSSEILRLWPCPGLALLSIFSGPLRV